MGRALARGLLAWLVLVGATATSSIVLADSPQLSIVPSGGSADSLVTAKYGWIGCGGLPAGTYMVVFFWGDTKSSLAPAPFDYSGKGDCAAEATFKIPADATAGPHQILADVEDLKGNPQPGSETSAPFTVDAGPATPAPTKAALETPTTTSAAVPTEDVGEATATPPAGAGTSSSSLSAPPWVGIAMLLAVVVGGSLLAFRTVLRRKTRPGTGASTILTAPGGGSSQSGQPLRPISPEAGPSPSSPGAPVVTPTTPPVQTTPIRPPILPPQPLAIPVQAPTADQRRNVEPLCDFAPDSWSTTGLAFEVNQGDSIPAAFVRVHGEPPAKLGGDYWHVPYRRGNRDGYWFGPRVEPEVDGYLQDVSQRMAERNAARGTRTSRPFRITFNYLSFLIAGDHDPTRLRVELVVRSTASAAIGPAGASTPGGSGRELLVVVRQATASDDQGCDDRFRQVVWDVRDLEGQIGMVRLVDASPDGHLDVADVECSNTRPANFRAPLWGFADLHAHPMAAKGFGGGLIAGDYDPASTTALDILPCDQPDAPFQPHWRDVGDFMVNNWPEGHQGNPAAWFWGDLPHQGRDGAPTFRAWPSFREGIHQQMHPEWIRRAHDGGLRLMVALVAHNEYMGGHHVVHPELAHTDWAVTQRQVQYWIEVCAANPTLMAIARSPSEARDIIESGRLAVILGLEVDSALGMWRTTNDLYGEALRAGHFAAPPGHDISGGRYIGPHPEPLIPSGGVRDPVFGSVVRQLIRTQLQRLWDLGIRQINPVHLADNPVGNTAIYNEAFNISQQQTFGFQQEVEAASDLDFRMGEERDGVTYAVASVADGYPPAHSQWDPTGAAPTGNPVDPWRPYAGHANAGPGLSDVGRITITEMIRMGFIIDVDHMSRRTSGQVMDMAENPETIISEAAPQGPYPLVSAHAGFRDLAPRRNWENKDQPGPGQRKFNRYWRHESEKTPEQLQRLRALGGLVAPITAVEDSLEFRDARLMSYVSNNCPGTTRTWAQALMYAADQMQGPVGLGTDMVLLIEMGPRFGPLAAYGLVPEELPRARWERHEDALAQDHGVRYDRVAATLPFVSPPDVNAEWKLNPYVFPQPDWDLGFGDRCAFATALWDALSRWANGDPIPSVRGDTDEVLRGFRAATEADAQAISPRALMAFQILNNLPPRVAPDGGRDPRSDFVLISDAVRMWRRMTGSNVPLDRCATGSRDWDFNTDGLAHYGMLPDMLQDVANIGVPQATRDALFQSTEAYVAIWERCDAVVASEEVARREAVERRLAPGALASAIEGRTSHPHLHP